MQPLKCHHDRTHCVSIMILSKSQNITKKFVIIWQASSNTSSPSGSAFFFFFLFSLYCSIGEYQPGSSHLAVLINPTVDVNLICTILRMVKIAVRSTSCWGVYSSFMRKLDPSNPLLYMSNY